MKNATYRAYLADPSAVHAQVQRAASRARAAAMTRHLLMPLAQFCGKLAAIRGVRLLLDPRAAAR